MVRRQRRAPEHGKRVEGKGGLPDPFPLRQGEAQPRHQLPEFLGIVEVPLKVATVQKLGGAEHLHRRPGFDQLAGQQCPRLPRVLEVGVVGFVAVPRRLQGIDGDPRVQTYVQRAAEVIDGIELAHEINVVVVEPMAPVEHESAVTDLDLPLDRGASRADPHPGGVLPCQQCRRRAVGDSGRPDLRDPAVGSGVQPQDQTVGLFLDGVADRPGQLHYHPRSVALPLATPYFSDRLGIGRD